MCVINKIPWIYHLDFNWYAKCWSGMFTWRGKFCFGFFVGFGMIKNNTYRNQRKNCSFSYEYILSPTRVKSLCFVFQFYKVKTLWEKLWHLSKSSYSYIVINVENFSKVFPFWKFTNSLDEKKNIENYKCFSLNFLHFTLLAFCFFFCFLFFIFERLFFFYRLTVPTFLVVVICAYIF